MFHCLQQLVHVCEQAAVSSETLYFTFLLSNKVLMKEDFSCLCLPFGFLYIYNIYIYNTYIYIYTTNNIYNIYQVFIFNTHF